MRPIRIDVQLHDILMKSAPIKEPQSHNGGLGLPEPIYPQVTREADMEKSDYHKLNALRVLKGWGIPYAKSRWFSKDLRPIIPYLFTEWKCNLDCHYCWSFNNKVKGMTEETARRSIDWLHSIGSRVLALMGGEPLLRPNFIHKVTNFSGGTSFL